MLRINIGSGMLRLSSCMLSMGLGPKCEQGKKGLGRQNIESPCNTNTRGENRINILVFGIRAELC